MNAAPNADSMMSMAPPATASAMVVSSIRLGTTTTVGSYSTLTAPMAVKCMKQMASVSSVGATHMAHAPRQAPECHHGRCAQGHAAQDCNRAQSEIPLQLARHDQGLHADEVHGRDARTDDRAADDGVTVARPGRDPKAAGWSRPRR